MLVCSVYSNTAVSRGGDALGTPLASLYLAQDSPAYLAYSPHVGVVVADADAHAGVC